MDFQSPRPSPPFTICRPLMDLLRRFVVEVDDGAEEDAASSTRDDSAVPGEEVVESTDVAVAANLTGFSAATIAVAVVSRPPFGG